MLMSLGLWALFLCPIRCPYCLISKLQKITKNYKKSFVLDMNLFDNKDTVSRVEGNYVSYIIWI